MLTFFKINRLILIARTIRICLNVSHQRQIKTKRKKMKDFININSLVKMILFFIFFLKYFVNLYIVLSSFRYIINHMLYEVIVCFCCFSCPYTCLS